jgi:hypothetical protein
MQSHESSLFDEDILEGRFRTHVKCAYRSGDSIKGWRTVGTHRLCFATP